MTLGVICKYFEFGFCAYKALKALKRHNLGLSRDFYLTMRFVCVPVKGFARVISVFGLEHMRAEKALVVSCKQC